MEKELNQTPVPKDPGPSFHRWTVLLVCLFCIMNLTAEVNAQETSDSNRLVIATPEWAGQTNADGTGLFFDIIKRVFEPENITLSFLFVPWPRAQKMVTIGKADAMLCVWEEHARKTQQQLPGYPMYVEYTAALMPRKNAAAFMGIESLTNLNALWLRGYDYHQFAFLQSVRFASWHEIDNPADAWPLLAAGRYDVFIDALIDMNRYLAENKDVSQRFAVKILWGEKAYISFHPGKKAERFAAIFDDRIKRLFETGELKAIYKRYHAVFTESAWYQPGAHATD